MSATLFVRPSVAAVAPVGWGLTAAHGAAVIKMPEPWLLPAALLRPCELLFTQAGDAPENFLAGLRAERLLGAGLLPVDTGHRNDSAWWVGFSLAPGPGRLFDEVRAGCWVREFPAVGRGRELLRAIGLGDAEHFATTLAELGLPADRAGPRYFNFHYNQPGADCDRVYVLDCALRALHGFAARAGGECIRSCA